MRRASRWTRIVSAARLLIGRAALADEEREMRDELRFHLDKSTEKNVAAGMSPADARRVAMLAFGGEARWMDAARDEVRSRPLEDLVRDLRHGARAFRRHLGFSTVATLTLSLGIAATVTVYGFVDSIFLRPLTAPRSDRLVRVYIAPIDLMTGGQREVINPLGYAAYAFVRDHVPAFDQVIAHYSTAPLYVSNGESPFEVEGAVVSANYFSALGVVPRLGRFFTPAEDQVPDRDFVAVIGYGLWQSHFGGDPRVVGRTIGINGRPFTIVGVAPESLLGINPGSTINQLWIPMMMIHAGYRFCDGLQPSCNVVDVMARLAPGATLAQARAQLATMSTHLAALAEPTDSLQPVVAMPALGVSPWQRRTMTSLAQLLSAIGLLLLAIACANVAGLLIARGSSRHVEVSVRMSLGAGRWRIVRQLLAESLVIAVAGGLVGVLVSVWSARALGHAVVSDAEGYARAFEIVPNARVLAFAAALSVVTALLFGLVPAIGTVSGGSMTGLRGGSAMATARTRTALVAMQTGLCVMLLVAAGLLVRSFARVTSRQNLDSSHLALLRLRPRLVSYDAMRAQAFLRRAVTALEALPDVERVAVARGIGFVWRSTGQRQLTLPGELVTKGRLPRPPVDYHEVSPHFFGTLGVPVVAGREFTDADGSAAPRVAIVNQSLAMRIASDGRVIGRTVALDDKAFQIVGVVADYQAHTANESPPSVAYVPFWQNDFEPQIDARVAVRVKGDAAAALPRLRLAIAAVDPLVPVTETMSMRSQIAGSYSSVGLGARLLIAAAALALVLTGIGLYGVVAYLVDRRAREVGIRIAVGANPSSVTALFVLQGLRPTLAGVVAGVVGSLMLAGPLSRWLYGVSPVDATAYGTATIGVIVVAIIASYIPARRASTIDPVVALRAE